MDTVLVVLAAIIVAMLLVVGGYVLAVFIRRAKEMAPTRTLQAINVLLTEYEHLAINGEEIAEAQARQTGNAARYKALEARMAGLPPTAVLVPANVTAKVS